mmetsp:Transcript_3453/g.10096  ORF Transcript_3453/g.10096 Transcript_3453/m.10096 type:complete len:270 (+) Transcript_3453:1878-2687(+)
MPRSPESGPDPPGRAGPGRLLDGQEASQTRMPREPGPEDAEGAQALPVDLELQRLPAGHRPVAGHVRRLAAHLGHRHPEQGLAGPRPLRAHLARVAGHDGLRGAQLHPPAHHPRLRGLHGGQERHPARDARHEGGHPGLPDAHRTDGELRASRGRARQELRPYIAGKLADREIAELQGGAEVGRQGLRAGEARLLPALLHVGRRQQRQRGAGGALGALPPLRGGVRGQGAGDGGGAPAGRLRRPRQRWRARLEQVPRARGPGDEQSAHR